jgi:N6-L-threonylcarbamoyladenine synthase
MRILGIETSCDETSVSIVEDGMRVLCNVIATSREVFSASGGVIPEDAARRQLQCIVPVLDQAFAEAEITWKEVDSIAVTRGPGLLGSLLIGTNAARTLASIHKLPLLGIHHTLGHLSSVCLESEPIQFPCLALSVSGGHTELWFRESHLRGTLLGRTRDDAVGEAFDKGAAILGLAYPGGPEISRAGAAGNLHAFPFPSPLKKEQTLDFSFSGLKTSLRYLVRDLGAPWQTRTADIAASYEFGLCAHLCNRVSLALERYGNVREVHAVGGVSANVRLRTMLQEVCSASGKTLRVPLKSAYCTDNAAMIASAAFFALQEDPANATQEFVTSATTPITSVFNAPKEQAK